MSNASQSNNKGNTTPKTTKPSLSEVTNSDFMEAIFINLEPNERPIIGSVFGDDVKKDFKSLSPESWSSEVILSHQNVNYYFTLSTYLPVDGKYTRKKNTFYRAYGIYFDDVGTKGKSREHLDNCPPSYLIETSHGNFQAGYIFDEPVVELSFVEDLINATIKAGFSDPGANGPSSRLGRLPIAINGKYDPYFQCKLVEWNPERRYSIDQIYEGLGLERINHDKVASTSKSANKHKAVNLSTPTRVYSPRASENPAITGLRLKGLYKQSLGEGTHDITCPWVHDHTNKIDSGTAYFEPSEQYSYGAFKCMHGHCVDRKLYELLEELDISFIDAKHRATITVIPGEIDGIVDAAEIELAEIEGYYQYAGSICNVITDPGSNVTSIKSVNKNDLQRVLSKSINWVQYAGDSPDVKIIDPPEKYINSLYSSSIYKHLQVLQGITRQPYLRNDGTLMTSEGFDPSTGMYGVFCADEYYVPECPSREMAVSAFVELKALLHEFSFAEVNDLSAALAMMLTAAIRPALSAAPMGHIKAHQIASGKSYLSSLIAAFASPSKPAAYAFPTNDEECSKLLLAALFEAPAVIMFDNLTSDLLPYKSLCSALTEGHLTGRILGASKTGTVGTRTLFLSSGNNVDPVKDMTRRAITISLDPQMELPATRPFQGDPCKLVLANRPQYVSLALTIIRAFIVAGCPMQKNLPSLASYDDWTRLVRAPLVWLGLPDPATALFTTIKVDPDRELLRRLMVNLYKTFGDKPISVSELVTRIDTEIGSVLNSDLAEVVREIAEQQGKINRRTLGRWISRHQGVIVDGYILSKSTKSGGSERWQVTQRQSLKSDISIAVPNDGIFEDLLGLEESTSISTTPFRIDSPQVGQLQ